MANPHRWREPLALTTIAVAIGEIVLSAITMAKLTGHDHLSWPMAANVVGGGSLPISILLVMGAACLACVVWKPSTARAASIARAGGWVAALGALLEAVLTVMGCFEQGPGAIGVLLECLGALLSIVLKVAVAWVLLRVSRPTGESGTAPRSGVEAPSVPATAPDAGVAPVWSPQEAVGTVWTRAGDAATGAAGQHAGSQQTGWQREVGHPANGDPIASEQGRNAPAPRHTVWPTAGDIARGQAVSGVGDDRVGEDPSGTGLFGASDASGDREGEQRRPQWRPVDRG